jgi:hypothetical protein
MPTGWAGGARAGVLCAALSPGRRCRAGAGGRDGGRVSPEPQRLPPQLHAASLHDLVAAYVQLALEGGDLAALGPLRLLRDRVELLLVEHARGAHDADGVAWRSVAGALGVHTASVTGWDRAVRQGRPPGSTPRPGLGRPPRRLTGVSEQD